MRQIPCSNINILRSSQRSLAAISSLPRISNRRCKNLLVRAKHHRQPLPRTSGAFRCHTNRCKRCPFITEGATNYTFFLYEQRRIRHRTTCSSSNLVYMILYNKCNVQYLGETKRHLYSPAKVNVVLHMISFVSQNQMSHAGTGCDVEFQVMI